MRVLVAGAGAIGQWLGARLAASHEVTLLLRAKHAAAIKKDGLRAYGHTEFSAPVEVITRPEGGPYDAIFITAKAHATAALAQAVAPQLADAGVLASLQNGLGNAPKLVAAVGAERAALCLTSHGVTQLGPGSVKHAGTGTTSAGPVPGTKKPASARRAHALLSDADLEPSWHKDMRPAVWTKAVVNAGINPVGAVHRVPNGGIAEDDDLRARAHAATAEAAAVARAVGIDVTDAAAVASVDRVIAATAENRCSMLQDVEAERPTEIEQITGRIRRLAARYGIPTPSSDILYEAIKGIESSYLGPGPAAGLTEAEDLAPFDDV